jgi:esterase/lipase superfamily enzyme
MRIEHHYWWSPALGHDMALKVYGYYGKPLVAFPCQEGRYWDFEDRGMIGAIAPFIEAGQVKVFAVDSIDWQTWANWGAHPAAAPADTKTTTAT